MFKSVLRLTKPVSKLTQTATLCNCARLSSVAMINETTCNINQPMVRYFAKDAKAKQSMKESKKKEKVLKSEETVNEPITKTSDLIKKNDTGAENKTKLSRKEEYERSVALKKAKEQELLKEKLKVENAKNENELNKAKEVKKEDVCVGIENFENEKEFIPTSNSWSNKILSSNFLKPAIKILEEHQNEFPLNEIPYIIKTFGVYFSLTQSKEGVRDIKNLSEFKSFTNFLDKYYENNFKDNTTKYPISPTQMVDVLITLYRLYLPTHPLYILLSNKIKSLTNSLTPSHLSKLLWLYASNNINNYHQISPIVNVLNENFSKLNEENLCRCLWSIAHLPYRFGFQEVLNNGLECLVKLNQTKQIELKRLISILPEIPNKNTNACKYFNVVFKMLIPYNGELTYADAVSILHAYVNHCDDITSSSVRKYDDILHKPTPELENLLNQSYILASEHINELSKSQLIQFSFYINHTKAPVPDHIMANIIRRTSEYIKDYSPSASLVALNLFGTRTKEFILDYLDIYSSLLEHVKSQLNQMTEIQLNITIIIFTSIHNMLKEEDKIIPTLMPLIYQIISKPNNTNRNYSTRLIATYLRGIKDMGLTKPTASEMELLLTQFVKGISLDKTPGGDIMLILSFSYVENRELVVQILKFIDKFYNDYTLNPLTAASLLESCVKYDYPSKNIYKLCLACFICDPEAVQLEEFTSFCRCSLKMNITSNTFKKLLPVFEKSISSFKATSLVDILTYISTMNFSYPKVFQIAKNKIIRDKRCLKKAFNVLYSYYRQNVDEEVFKDIYNHFFNSIKPEELDENDKDFYEKVLCEVYK